jgi:hypothetical protein
MNSIASSSRDRQGAVTGLEPQLGRSRRGFLAVLGGAGLLRGQPKTFDVRAYGAVGDGKTLDTAAIQRALDEAAAAGGGARVLIPGGKRYRTGALKLKGGIDLHLADDAALEASTDPADYTAGRGLLLAEGAQGLRITGTGCIDGQAMQFMTGYSKTDERWEPKPFRPRMLALTACRDLEISGITILHAPEWTVHLLGCERVLVDGIKIRNHMDVPNCDGIDPDHCRYLEIRNCDIVCADDAIVLKNSRQPIDYGPTRNVIVRDCVVETRDSGLKIGTETFGDVYHVLFERCKVRSGGRGPTITHRQAGNIYDIEFRDIEIAAEHHAARWWGWGEAISLTVRPRASDGVVGKLSDVRIRRVSGRAENSVRIDGSKDNPVRNLLLEGVDVTIDRWTAYPGGMFDNRPTGPGVPGLEPHSTPAFSIRRAEHVTLEDCRARWGGQRQHYFSHALEAEDVKDLELTRFTGEAAHPDRDEAVVVR